MKISNLPHTPGELKKNKQKQRSKQARQTALSWLAKKFPEAFDNQYRIRPLKIGVMEDILDYAEEARLAGISKTKLREAVVLFTRRVDYLTCLKAKEYRIDLFGQPIEIVSDEDAAAASEKIKKRVEKAQKHAYLAMANSSRRMPLKATSTNKSQPAITIKRKLIRPMLPQVEQKLREKLDLENT